MRRANIFTCDATSVGQDTLYSAVKRGSAFDTLVIFQNMPN
jgi:hypothetical protein